MEQREIEEIKTLNRFANLTPGQRKAKIKDKLERLATWPADELAAYYATWPHAEVVELWELLKPTFQGMCQRFGLMRPSSRVKIQGIKLHQQIKRLAELQKAAKGEEI